MGYPAWSLLYFTLLCSLPQGRRSYTVIETGTNLGFSTIVLAQALRDLGAEGTVHTVDIDPQATAAAQKNVERAGLLPLVRFYTDDSLKILRQLGDELGLLDFVFLDGNHETTHVTKEFALVRPHLAPGAKVYFDNTNTGDVALALERIHRKFGGNLLRFPNCSWSPAGNAVWQP
jgi:predicted O-methyltransferase YrrM